MLNVSFMDGLYANSLASLWCEFSWSRRQSIHYLT